MTKENSSHLTMRDDVFIRTLRLRSITYDEKRRL